METVNVGIVGLGMIGTLHMNNLLGDMPGCGLTAVCDLDPGVFAKIPAARKSGIACFTELDAFLASDVRLVIVAVPHYSHPEIAVRALKAGKHIIVEKPIAVHKAAAEQLLAESAKHPELLQSAMFNQRTRGSHKKIKQMIDTGELGTITRFNWIITDWFRPQCYYDSGDWRASWRGEGGGVLLNQCPHQLDLVQWFFGMPSTVRAAVKLGKYHDIEVEDEVNAYLEYADGKVGNFIASTGEMPGTNRLEITGSRGRLVFEHGNLEFLRNEIETPVFSRTTRENFGVSPVWRCEIPTGKDRWEEHRVIVQNMADAIRGKASLIAPLAEGIRSLELGNAMLLSGLTDKTVALPLDSAEYARKLEQLIATSRYRKKGE